ncbi:MAG: HNH endonuclease [Bacteroidaceae bacterium]|nr:HNH endonuclease [Bacteroidaceae bacterium]
MIVRVCRFLPIYYRQQFYVISVFVGEAELHHLVPKGLDEEKTLDLDNVVLVCGKCHQQIHGHAREGEA